MIPLDSMLEQQACVLSQQVLFGVVDGRGVNTCLVIIFIIIISDKKN